MKTRNYLVMAAALAAFSACSNNDETPIQKGDETVSFASMTIRLDAPKTYADVSNSVGTESKLNETLVCVQTTGDDGAATAAYRVVALKAGATQATVMFPVDKSTVYVFSNPPSAEFKLAVEGCKTEVAFQNLLQTVEKKYISKLNTQDGSFMMSGKAVINNASGAIPYILPVTLYRDLSKVSFQVKQNSVKVEVDGSTINDADNKLISVEQIEIQRAADNVAPFRYDGANFSGYEVTPAWGTANYVADTSDNDGVGGTPGTNYNFKYSWRKDVDGTRAFLFDNFYVLPNYAQIATTGTVVVLKAKVKTTTTPAGEDRYYRARISNDMNSYITEKNTHYIITAAITGEGVTTPEVPENMEDQLIVSIQVAPWALVTSDQIIGQ